MRIELTLDELKYIRKNLPDTWGGMKPSHISFIKRIDNMIAAAQLLEDNLLLYKENT